MTFLYAESTKQKNNIKQLFKLIIEYSIVRVGKTDGNKDLEQKINNEDCSGNKRKCTRNTLTR